MSGEGVIRESGKLGIKSSGKVAVFPVSGTCPACCGNQCTEVFIVGNNAAYLTVAGIAHLTVDFRGIETTPDNNTFTIYAKLINLQGAADTFTLTPDVTGPNVGPGGPFMGGSWGAIFPPVTKTWTALAPGIWAGHDTSVGSIAWSPILRTAPLPSFFDFSFNWATNPGAPVVFRINFQCGSNCSQPGCTASKFSERDIEVLNSTDTGNAGPAVGQINGWSGGEQIRVLGNYKQGITPAVSSVFYPFTPSYKLEMKCDQNTELIMAGYGTNNQIFLEENDQRNTRILFDTGSSKLILPRPFKSGTNDEIALGIAPGTWFTLQTNYHFDNQNVTGLGNAWDFEVNGVTKRQFVNPPRTVNGGRQYPESPIVDADGYLSLETYPAFDALAAIGGWAVKSGAVEVKCGKANNRPTSGISLACARRPNLTLLPLFHASATPTVTINSVTAQDGSVLTGLTGNWTFLEEPTAGVKIWTNTSTVVGYGTRLIGLVYNGSYQYTTFPTISTGWIGGGQACATWFLAYQLFGTTYAYGGIQWRNPFPFTHPGWYPAKDPAGSQIFWDNRDFVEGESHYDLHFGQGLALAALTFNSNVWSPGPPANHHLGNLNVTFTA